MNQNISEKTEWTVSEAMAFVRNVNNPSTEFVMSAEDMEKAALEKIREIVREIIREELKPSLDQ